MDKMNDMTPQEIFDKVVNHLRAQGAKSEMDHPTEGPICAYRGDGGLMCAVGCLIPDLDYDPGMEETAAPYLAIFVEWSADDRQLLEDLQQVHDRTQVEHWEDDFAAVAAQNNLTYTPVSEVSL